MRFKGEVFTGMNKAGEYLSMTPYQEKIRDKTGFKPFPGTLNLRVEKKKVQKLKQNQEKKRIDQFSYKGEELSGLNLYSISIEGTDAVFIDIDITEYDDTVMEIIAPCKLRKKLGIEDGDTAKIDY